MIFTYRITRLTRHGVISTVARDKISPTASPHVVHCHNSMDGVGWMKLPWPSWAAANNFCTDVTILPNTSCSVVKSSLLKGVYLTTVWYHSNWIKNKILQMVLDIAQPGAKV